MFYIEFDWMTGTYKFRIGETFTDFRGIRSMESIEEWKAYLSQWDYRFVKCDTRTWRVIPELQYEPAY